MYACEQGTVCAYIIQIVWECKGKFKGYFLTKQSETFLNCISSTPFDYTFVTAVAFNYLFHIYFIRRKSDAVSFPADVFFSQMKFVLYSHRVLLESSVDSVSSNSKY